MGNNGRTSAGDVQVMSAGSGVLHAEHNLEPGPTTLFQIWIEPDRLGGQPSWGAREFPKSARTGQWSILASGKGDPDALAIRADARVIGATLDEGQELSYKPEPRRHIYFALAVGALAVNGRRVNARDGVAIKDEPRLVFKAFEAPVEIVLTDTQ